MQSKISSFFKPPPPPPSSSTAKSAASVIGDVGDELALWEKTKHNIFNTYERRGGSKSCHLVKRSEAIDGSGSEMVAKPALETPCSNLEPRNSGKVLNKKRSYAQLHLELGQSDFYLRTCPTCVFKYNPGEEEDEKDHKTFHKNYTHGIPFRISVNQKVVSVPCTEGGRIVLVSDCDPPALRNKVQDVIKMMELELGGGWIFQELCKVYLFVFSQRVAGCLVCEPIKEAFKVLSCSGHKKSHEAMRSKTKDSKSNSTVLQFGEITLHRESKKKAPSVNSIVDFDGNHNGAIICEDKAVPAVCGIRAIWVTPANRRKRVASQLLDAARKSFCMGIDIEKSEIAFSSPTAAGKALASSYFGSASFLVYKNRGN